MKMSFFSKNIFIVMQHLLKASNVRVVSDILIAIIKSIEVLILDVLFKMYLVQMVMSKADLISIYYLVSVFAIYKILMIVIENIHANLIIPITNEKIDVYFANLIHKKLASTDMTYYDNNEYYDKLIYANNNIKEKSVDLLKSCALLIQTVLTIIFTATYVLYVDYILLLFIIIPILIDARLRVKMSSLEHQREIELERSLREQKYAMDVLKNEKYAKEVRLSNISNSIISMYTKAFYSMCNTYKKFELKIIKLYLMSDFLYEPKNILVIIYIAYCVIILKRILPAEFLAVQSAIISLNSNMGKINERIVAFKKHDLFASHFNSLLNIKNEIVSGDIKIDKINKITFNNITFSYPGNEQHVLNNLNLSIKAGEKIAIVGNNGAGKSTLIKMLCRFYDPIDGNILINGYPLKSLDLKSYRDNISFVSQNFNLYCGSIYDNIITERSRRLSETDLNNILNDVGLFKTINNLEEGINSFYGKGISSDGYEFSIGQMQGLSIARAYAKNGQLLIMDEPSSSLDAYAENRILKAIDKISKDKIVIVITHRLTLTKNFDKIAVISEGKISEIGTHEKLIGQKGIYYNLYNAQQRSVYNNSV